MAKKSSTARALAAKRKAKELLPPSAESAPPPAEGLLHPVEAAAAPVDALPPLVEAVRLHPLKLRKRASSPARKTEMRYLCCRYGKGRPLEGLRSAAPHERTRKGIVGGAAVVKQSILSV